MNNIFVGNLDFTATKEQVRKLFEQYGTVAGVAVVEKKKGKSRGFAFVDMPNEEEKNVAISALEGKEFMGRALIVNPMRPKIPKVKKFFKSKKPWENSQDSHSSSRGESRPYRGRDDRESKPFSKPYQSRDDRGNKPYGKSQGDYKPYRSDDRSSKPYGKAQGDYKPYRNDERSPKPYSKPQGEYKPFRKDDREAKPSYNRDDRDSRGPRREEGASKSYGNKSQGDYKSFQSTKPWGKSKRASQAASHSGNKSFADKKEASTYSDKPKHNLQSGYGTKSWPKKQGGFAKFRKKSV